jgi:hypothetical protein
MKHCCFLLILATAVFACLKPAGPGIFADIYVRYEQGERKIKAEATFYKGETPGSAKSIVFQTGVGFLGSSMESRSLPGGIERYEFETVANLPEFVPIHFTDDLGEEKNIDIQVPAIRDFEFLTIPLKKTEGFSLKLDAAPLAGNEKLVLVFTDYKNQSLTLEVNAASAMQQIDFAPGQLRKLEPGNVQVYLVRTGSVSKKEGRYSINIQTEFYSKIKTITLE